MVGKKNPFFNFCSISLSSKVTAVFLKISQKKKNYFADFLLKTQKYGKIDLSKIVAHPQNGWGRVLQNFLSDPPFWRNCKKEKLQFQML